MGNVIRINFKPEAIESIKISRTEEFKAAHELSDYIRGLSLSHEANDKLVALMVNQVNVSEQAAFDQGMELGIKITKAHMEGKL